MYLIRGLFFIFISVSLYVGCSDVGFNIRPSNTCIDFNITDGVCTQGEGFNTYQTSFRTGRVDILFVVDNSGSMFVEQANMANRLSNLLNKINVNNLDYQIGVITTDVSVSPNAAVPKEANGFGDFQDGKLLRFPDGSSFLTSNSANVLQQLKDTLQREESLACDNNNYNRDLCPSDDERAIYALNMAIDRPENSAFFRSNAHLAVVILSDEDERTSGGELSTYPLESYDLPETLVQKVNAQLGVTKIFSVHAIIIKPGDYQCLSHQTFIPTNGIWAVRGKYGDIYKELAKPSDELKSFGNIVDGTLGNICATDYGAQMGNIGSLVNDEVDSYQLPCAPEEGEVQISSPNDPTTFTYTLDENNVLRFEPAIQSGAIINLQWVCPNYL